MNKEVLLKDGSTLIIRPFEEKDAEDAVAYMHTVCAETTFLSYEAGEFAFTVEQERAFIKSLENAPQSCILGGFVNGVLVANTNIQGQTKARLKHTCAIGISVQKAFWGLGVGSALLTEVIERAKAGGVKVVHLTVNADNERAISLYKKFGFELAGTHKGELFINGEYSDMLAMDLHL